MLMNRLARRGMGLTKNRIASNSVRHVGSSVSRPYTRSLCASVSPASTQSSKLSPIPNRCYSTVDGGVQFVHDVDAFNHHLHSGEKVVAYFTASWCGPCKAIAPVYSDLASRYDGVTFLKIDIDHLGDLAIDHDVSAVPTFIFFFKGAVKGTLIGDRRKELCQAVDQFASDEAIKVY